MQVIRQTENQVENEIRNSFDSTSSISRPELISSPLEIFYSSTLNPDSTTHVNIPSTFPEPSPNDHSSHINPSSPSSTFKPFENNPLFLPPIDKQIYISHSFLSNSNDLEELFPSNLKRSIFLQF